MTMMIKSCNDTCSIVEFLPRENFESPQVIQLLCKVAYLTSIVSIKLNRVQRRHEHPYLYIAGVLLNEQIGNDSIFLSSVAKVIQAARLFHSSFETAFKIQNSLNDIYKTISMPMSLVTIGYLHAAQNNPYRHIIEKKVSPSYIYDNPFILLVVRRCEIIIHQIFKTLELCCIYFLQLFELWKTISDNQTDIQDDIMIEVMELYKMYDVSHPEALLFQMKKTASFIETMFNTFEIPISVTAFFNKIESILQTAHAVETQFDQSLKKVTQVSVNTNVIARSIFGY